MRPSTSASVPRVAVHLVEGEHPLLPRLAEPVEQLAQRWLRVADQVLVAAQQEAVAELRAAVDQLCRRPHPVPDAGLPGEAEPFPQRQRDRAGVPYGPDEDGVREHPGQPWHVPGVERRLVAPAHGSALPRRTARTARRRTPAARRRARRGSGRAGRTTRCRTSRTAPARAPGSAAPGRSPARAPGASGRPAPAASAWCRTPSARPRRPVPDRAGSRSHRHPHRARAQPCRLLRCLSWRSSANSSSQRRTDRIQVVVARPLEGRAAHPAAPRRIGEQRAQRRRQRVHVVIRHQQAVPGVPDDVRRAVATVEAHHRETDRHRLEQDEAGSLRCGSS